MTALKKWKKEQGLTYEGVVKRLGGQWKRAHIINVFNGTNPPGLMLYLAIEDLTGLSKSQILENFDLPGLT